MQAPGRTRDAGSTPESRDVGARSGWRDLNPRPPAPKAGALPSCATPRGRTSLGGPGDGRAGAVGRRADRSAVVDDQVGRLSFAEDIAAGIAHLLAVGAPYGVYNLSNGGEPASWAAIAKRVYALTGADPARVTGTSTEAYFAGKQAAPRPAHSTLDTAKLEATGFTPRDQDEALRAYLG